MSPTFQQLLDGPRILVVVPGAPYGYVAYATSHNRSTLRYWNWCDKVRTAFSACNFDLPLYADNSYPLFFHTRAYFATRRHHDPENVHKGVKDALFYKSTGPGDKFTCGTYDLPLYDYDNPRTEIELSGWVAKQMLQKQGAL